jgi:hypothetical protein
MRQSLGRKLKLRDNLMKRLLVGLAGGVILGLSALFTLGTSLAAPFGVMAAASWARRRERPLTRIRSWLGAVTASSLAIICAFALAAARAPEGAFQQIQDAAARSEQAPTAQPPAWIARVFPQATRPPDPVTEGIVRSRAFTVYFGLMGAGIAVAILGTMVGSVGWAGTMLLARAFSRRLAA